MDYNKLKELAVQHGVCPNCCGPMDLGWGYKGRRHGQCAWCHWVQLFGRLGAAYREKKEYIRQHFPDYTCSLCGKERRLHDWTITTVEPDIALLVCRYCNRRQRADHYDGPEFDDAIVIRRMGRDPETGRPARSLTKHSHWASLVKRIRKRLNNFMSFEPEYAELLGKLCIALKARLANDELAERTEQRVRKELRECLQRLNG